MQGYHFEVNIVYVAEELYTTAAVSLEFDFRERPIALVIKCASPPDVQRSSVPNGHVVTRLVLGAQIGELRSTFAFLTFMPVLQSFF